jgi:hypothetical protein
MRPNFGEIKNVVTVRLSLIGGHGLLFERYKDMHESQVGDTYQICGPDGVIAILDVFEEGLNAVIGVRACEFACFFVVKSLY